MPPRPHDPFNDAPRRPTSRATSHLHDTYSSGGHALRANTAARSLFAPALSRRPTTTGPSSTHLNDELVLEDSDDAGDRMSRRAAAAGRATRTRRARAATETTIEPDEEIQPEPLRDMVVRDEKGNYLHEVPALGEHTNGAEDEGDIEDERRLTALVQEYWASGAAAGGGRNSKRWDEHELERPKAEVMTRLRDSVGKALINEQWRYEPSDYMKALLVENHGRV